MWVPLVVALVGLGGVLGAQLVAGWREDRRWQREVQREELRWQREQAERRHNGREDAYGRMIGALEAWQWMLYPVKEQVLSGAGALTDEQRGELESMHRAARDVLGPMNLHAPATVRNLMRDAVLAKADFTSALLGARLPATEELRATLLAQYQKSLEVYYAMRAAMRLDLGIDSPGEETPTAHSRD